MPARLALTALPGIGEVRPGDRLADVIAAALDGAGLAPAAQDVIVVAQKVVSKAEGRFVTLDEVSPSPRARELAAIAGKDARLVELMLGESRAVLRCVPGVIIVEHRLGFVMANAGIDRSNLGPRAAEQVLLLPVDPDGSAAALCQSLQARYGVPLAVIVSDSFGRAWRNGVVNIALGAAGLPALIDARGRLDRDGRVMQVTEIGFADAIAAAAGLVLGECDEGSPAAHVRGACWDAPALPAAALLRPRAEDLFR